MKTWKKIMGLLFIIFIFVISNVSVSAAQDVAVYMNDAEIIFDVPPMVVDGRTLVPVRAIFEKLGAVVEWDDVTSTVRAHKGNESISIPVGASFMKDEADSIIPLDVPARIEKGRTLIPLRAVSEAFHCDVEWDGEIRTVDIYTYDYLESVQNQEDSATMLYAPDGRTVSVQSSKVDRYTSQGWYTKPVLTMYTADGRESVILQEEMEYYKDSGWYTEPLVTMYSLSGGSTLIFKSEVEYYKSQGWYTEPIITLYSETGETNYVFQSEVAYYQTVGWYTLDDYIFIRAEKDVKEYDYATAVLNLEDLLEAWADDEISLSDEVVYQILDKLDDLTTRWYQTSGTPLAVMEWNRDTDSIGTPEIQIDFRNISNKTVVALETRFTCYDAYGNVTTNYPSLYNGNFTGYADDVYIEPGETWTLTWTLYSNDRTTRISWPKLLKVAFEDGTTWYD